MTTLQALTPWRRIRAQDWDFLVRIVVCLAIILSFALVTPGFASTNNAFAILQIVAFQGFAALGVGVTMIAGEVDLSIGSMAVLGGVISILLQHHGVAVSMLVPVIMGAVVGSLQGVLVSKLRISSLVLTIGTLILFSGLAYVLSGESSISLDDFSITIALSNRFWILSPVSIAFFLFVILTWLVLRYSRYGRELYAVGGGRKEAEAAGVQTLRPLTLAFGFSGAMGAMVGVLVSLTTGGATPTGFNDLLLSAVAAAVIGGIALSGGKGGAWGIALGAVALGVVSNGVNVLGAQFYVHEFVTGGLLLAILAVDMVGDRVRSRR